MSSQLDTVEQAHLSGHSPPARAATCAGDSSSVAHRRRVLVVDDKKSILHALRRLLRREPYELIAAHNRAEALAAMEQEPADLVISDQRMPGMMDTELLRNIRNRWPNTIHIILSTYSEVNTIIGAINEGKIYKYITKPWNDQEIKLHIRRALEQHELESSNRPMAEEIDRQNQRLRKLNTLLERRDADVLLGLTFVEQLMKIIDAGVICVDPQGLIVGVNEHVGMIMPFELAEVNGSQAARVLPRALVGLLAVETDLNNPDRCCAFEHAGNDLQSCCRTFSIDKKIRRCVLTVWKEVA